MIQIVIKEHAYVAGTKVSEVKWPKGGALVGLAREQLSIVPQGDNDLLAGDAVYVIVTPESQKAFVKLFNK